MTEKEIRLAYAARIIARSLDQGRHDIAFNALNYASKNASEFGLRKPSIDERKQINSLKHAPARSTYVNQFTALQALIDACDADWDLMNTAGYVASLLCDRDEELFTLAALATADIHIQNLLLVVSFGAPSAEPVDAVPLFPLGLAAYADGPVSLDRVKEAALAGQHFIESELLAPRSLAKASEVAAFGVYTDDAPTSSEQSPQAPINAIRFAQKIVQSLRGQLTFAFDRNPEITLSPAQESVLRPLADTLSLARDKAIPGLHFALRDKSPRHGLKVVQRALTDAGLKPIVAAATGINDLMAEILSHQIICMLQAPGDAVPPMIVADEYELLGSPEEIQQIENIVDETGPAVQQVFDTMIMSEQKIVLRDKADAFIAPVIWLIDEPRPITEELIGAISEILLIPSDDVAEKASAVVALGERHGIAISEATSRQVASCVTNVEDIDGVIKLAALRGTTDNLVRSCRKLLAASKTNQALPVQAPERFDIRYVRSSIVIPEIIEKLAPLRDRAISVLLHGAPGTSKTSLARHLAERMGMRVLSKKYSEISGWRVSDTEKGVSRIFQQAVAEDAFLIIDECDSLIRSRDKANHQWEQTTVNEMLTCMDAHPLPFACTTNYLKDLDAAAVRRFRFKIELLPLDRERARLAWVNILGLCSEEFPENDSLENLTISDFSRVASQMTDLNEKGAKYALISLAAEKDGKNSRSTGPIGFLAK